MNEDCSTSESGNGSSQFDWVGRVLSCLRFGFPTRDFLTIKMTETKKLKVEGTREFVLIRLSLIERNFTLASFQFLFHSLMKMIIKCNSKIQTIPCFTLFVTYLESDKTFTSRCRQKPRSEKWWSLQQSILYCHDSQWTRWQSLQGQKDESNQKESQSSVECSIRIVGLLFVLN